jgi:uncharacterized protein YbaA (DUF1428 family)
VSLKAEDVPASVVADFLKALNVSLKAEDVPAGVVADFLKALDVGLKARHLLVCLIETLEY